MPRRNNPIADAGYEILTSQHVDPTFGWLVNARKDLIEEYDGLKQTEKASQFRAEQAKINSADAAVSKK